MAYIRAGARKFIDLRYRSRHGCSLA